MDPNTVNFREAYMSLGRNAGRVLTFTFSLILLCSLLAGSSLAQNSSNSQSASNSKTTDDYPKVDLFVGYQWLHPGGTIPAPFHSPLAPVGMKLRDIPQGVGTSL